MSNSTKATILFVIVVISLIIHYIRDTCSKPLVISSNDIQTFVQEHSAQDINNGPASRHGYNITSVQAYVKDNKVHSEIIGTKNNTPFTLDLNGTVAVQNYEFGVVLDPNNTEITKNSGDLSKLSIYRGINTTTIYALDMLTVMSCTYTEVNGTNIIIHRDVDELVKNLGSFVLISTGALVVALMFMVVQA